MGEQCDGRVDAIFLFTFKLAIRLSVAFVFAQRFLLPFFFCWLVVCAATILQRAWHATEVKSATWVAIA